VTLIAMLIQLRPAPRMIVCANKRGGARTKKNSANRIAAAKSHLSMTGLLRLAVGAGGLETAAVPAPSHE
jgi:hypothetical protein